MLIFLLIVSVWSRSYPLYTWVQITHMEGLVPLPRGGHTMSTIGRVLYVFGGCDVTMQCFNDLHSFNTDTFTWSRLNSTGDRPSKRGGHSAIVLGTRIIIFGGSSQSLEYNDLYEYDAVNDHWKNLLPEGERPTGRSNHAAGVDSDGNMIIFGGYNSRGYLNDVWLYSPSNNVWISYQTSGDAPTPRELLSMNIVLKQAYTFGGFHEGGVSSEMYMLDAELMVWQQLKDDGYIPEPREGHAAVRIGDFLFLIGGCDYGKTACYNDVYVLDLLTLWWTKLEHKEFTPQPALKERHAASNVGENIYVFGGCYLGNHCFNDLMLINTGLECLNDCNDNGVCRGDICVCDKGYMGNECEIKPKCYANCLYRGLCTSSAKCDCYPGYKGAICEYESNCPNNCTSILNGVCQPNGECQCNLGYSGPSCTCDCVNGVCHDGGCICEAGWRGSTCSIKIEEESESSSDENQSDTDTQEEESTSTESESQESSDSSTESSSETESETQESSDNSAESSSEAEIEAQESSDNSTESSSDAERETQESSGNSTESSSEAESETEESSDDSTESSNDENSTETASSGVFIQKLLVSNPSSNSPVFTQMSVKSEIPLSTECENDCSRNGKCINQECYCNSGWTGNLCNTNISNKEGYPMIIASMLTFGFILAGAIIGFCYFGWKKIIREPEEFNLIN